MRTLLILLLAVPVAAQTTDSPVAADTTLPAVTVTASRVPMPTQDAPARVTLLGNDLMEAVNSASVADLLEARGPVFIRRYGSSGLASMSLRGSAASQTLILLDGRRLADPQLGQLDVSLLPTVMLESVEVLHGGGSALYGTDALGGVVHLRSVRPSAKISTRLNSEVGAWGQRRLGSVASGESGRWSAVVAAESESANEDFSYLDRTRIDQPLVRNAGWDRERITGYGAIAYKSGRSTLRAAMLYTDSERGLGGTDSVGARQWDTTTRFWLDGSQSTFWGKVEAGGYFQRSSLRYASPFPSSRSGAIDDTGTTTVSSFDVRTHLSNISGWQFIGDITVGTGKAVHPSLSGSASDSFAAIALSGAQTRGRVRLFPAIRLDGYMPSGGERKFTLSPQLGVNWQPLTTEAIRLKASGGRAFRMPTFNDRFWQPGGNPDLLPESGWNGDVGFLWSSRRTHTELTLFGAVARDQIVWSPTDEGYYAPENVSKTRTFGVEVSADRKWLLGSNALLGAGGLATFADARDRSDPTSSTYNQQVRYVPRWTAKAWSALHVGAFKFDLGLQAVGIRSATTDASQSLDPYFVLEGQIRYQREVGPVHATLALVAENLTDHYYEVIQSYVMPPRHFSVRLTIQTN